MLENDFQKYKSTNVLNEEENTNSDKTNINNNNSNNSTKNFEKDNKKKIKVISVLDIDDTTKNMFEPNNNNYYISVDNRKTRNLSKIKEDFSSYENLKIEKQINRANLEKSKNKYSDKVLFSVQDNKDKVFNISNLEYDTEYNSGYSGYYSSGGGSLNLCSDEKKEEEICTNSKSVNENGENIFSKNNNIDNCFEVNNVNINIDGMKNKIKNKKEEQNNKIETFEDEVFGYYKKSPRRKKYKNKFKKKFGRGKKFFRKHPYVKYLIGFIILIMLITVVIIIFSA